MCGKARADGVDVRARGDPVETEHRLGRRGRGDDDIGGAHGVLDRRGGFDAELGGQCLGLLRVAAGDEHAVVLADGGKDAEMRPRLVSGADDRERSGVFARKCLGGHRRAGGRADGGDRRSVHHGQSLTCVPVEERDRALVRVEASRGVGRHDADGLEAVERPLATAERRHQPDQRLLARRADDRSQRKLHLTASERAERRAHRIDAALGVEQLLDVLLTKHEHVCHRGRF